MKVAIAVLIFTAILVFVFVAISTTINAITKIIGEKTIELFQKFKRKKQIN